MSVILPALAPRGPSAGAFFYWGGRLNLRDVWVNVLSSVAADRAFPAAPTALNRAGSRTPFSCH